MSANNIRRGQEAELVALLQLVSQGCAVSIPLGTQSYDAVIDKGGKLYRIQIKRAYVREDTKSMVVGLRRARNQKYKKGAYDYLLAVDTVNGRVWIFPEREVRGRAEITLGNKKLKYLNSWN